MNQFPVWSVVEQKRFRRELIWSPIHVYRKGICENIRLFKSGGIEFSF
jgi:hypothetical protein